MWASTPACRGPTAPSSALVGWSRSSWPVLVVTRPVRSGSRRPSSPMNTAVDQRVASSLTRTVGITIGGDGHPRGMGRGIGTAVCRGARGRGDPGLRRTPRFAPSTSPAGPLSFCGSGLGQRGLRRRGPSRHAGDVRVQAPRSAEDRRRRAPDHGGSEVAAANGESDGDGRPPSRPDVHFARAHTVSIFFCLNGQKITGVKAAGSGTSHSPTRPSTRPPTPPAGRPELMAPRATSPLRYPTVAHAKGRGLLPGGSSTRRAAGRTTSHGAAGPHTCPTSSTRTNVNSRSSTPGPNPHVGAHRADVFNVAGTSTAPEGDHGPERPLAPAQQRLPEGGAPTCSTSRFHQTRTSPRSIMRSGGR